MKKNLIILPLLALLLSACGGNNQNFDPTRPSETTSEKGEIESSLPSNETTIIPEETTSEKPNKTEDKTSSETTPDINTETTPDINTETNPDIETSTETKPSHPDYLPNGQKWLTGPKNLANPLDISKKRTFGIDYGMPDNWSYIYGNNKTRGDWYVANGENIAIKFADENRGLQTPAFTSSTRMEIELLATVFHGTDVERKNDKKDTFLVYGFNEYGQLVEQQSVTPFKKGIDKDRNQPLKIEFYIENPEVRYAEIRLNDRLFNNQQNCKYVNFGVSEMSLQAYTF